MTINTNLKPFKRSSRIFFLLTFFLTLLLSVSGGFHFDKVEAQTTGFSVKGTQIFDPEQKSFIPLGANLVGWNYYGWDTEAQSTLQDVDKVEKVWNFNIIRASAGLKEQVWEGRTYSTKTWQNNRQEALSAFDKIVDTYTKRKIVVMLEAHDWTCEFPKGNDINLLRDFWFTLAKRYNNNPYVWFNLLNEPGFTPGRVEPEWISTHQQLIKTIRTDAKANNIIVVDGTQCGQDAGIWGTESIPEQNSAILSHGKELKQFDGKVFPNIVFSLHMYDQWGYQGQKMDSKLSDYLDRVHAKGHAILIGEVGDRGQGDTNHRETTGTAFRVAPQKGVGILAWHFQPKDNFSLLKDKNAEPSPSNLTPGFGQYFWDAR